MSLVTNGAPIRVQPQRAVQDDRAGGPATATSNASTNLRLWMVRHASRARYQRIVPKL